LVQVGNFHIGSSATVEKPTIALSEAHLLWDKLLKRYDVIHTMRIYGNYIHDKDLKTFANKIIEEEFENEVKALEPILNALKIQLPPRPPEVSNIPADLQIIEDKFIFRRIFTSIQDFLDAHIQIIASLVTNDPARALCINFLKQELSTLDELIKFGKQKGWLEITPIYKP
jgi:hypothetical protein